jgi:hypothetical protein
MSKYIFIEVFLFLDYFCGSNGDFTSVFVGWLFELVTEELYGFIFDCNGEVTGSGGIITGSGVSNTSYVTTGATTWAGVITGATGTGNCSLFIVKFQLL